MIRLVTAAIFLLVPAVTVACSGSSEAVTLNNKAVELINEERWEEALAELDKAIELDPNLAEAYNNRGRAYSELGQYEQALTEYNKAIRLNPNNAVAYYNRGGCTSIWSSISKP